MDGNPIDDILTSTEKALGVTFTPEEREQMKAKYKGDAELAFQDMINSTKKYKNIDFTYKERVDMKSKYKVPLAWVDVMALSENPEMKSNIKNKAGESSAAGYWQVTKDHESDIRKMYGVSHEDFIKDPNIQERYVREKLEPEYDRNLSNFKNIAAAGIQEGRYKDFEDLMVKGKFTDDQIKALNHVLGSTGAAHFLRTGTFLGTNPERKARDVKRTLGEVINIRKIYGVPSFISDQYDFGGVETAESRPAAEEEKDKVATTPTTVPYQEAPLAPGRTKTDLISPFLPGQQPKAEEKPKTKQEPVKERYGYSWEQGKTTAPKTIEPAKPGLYATTENPVSTKENEIKIKQKNVQENKQAFAESSATLKNLGNTYQTYKEKPVDLDNLTDQDIQARDEIQQVIEAQRKRLESSEFLLKDEFGENVTKDIQNVLSNNAAYTETLNTLEKKIKDKYQNNVPAKIDIAPLAEQKNQISEEVKNIRVQRDALQSKQEELKQRLEQFRNDPAMTQARYDVIYANTKLEFDKLYEQDQELYAREIDLANNFDSITDQQNLLISQFNKEVTRLNSEYSNDPDVKALKNTYDKYLENWKKIENYRKSPHFDSYLDSISSLSDLNPTYRNLFPDKISGEERAKELAKLGKDIVTQKKTDYWSVENAFYDVYNGIKSIFTDAPAVGLTSTLINSLKGATFNIIGDYIGMAASLADLVGAEKVGRELRAGDLFGFTVTGTGIEQDVARGAIRSDISGNPVEYYYTVKEGDDQLKSVGLREGDKVIIEDDKVVSYRGNDDFKKDLLMIPGVNTNEIVQNFIEDKKDEVDWDYSLSRNIVSSIPSAIDMVSLIAFNYAAVPRLTKFITNKALKNAAGLTLNFGAQTFQQYGDLYKSYLDQGQDPVKSAQFALGQSAGVALIELFNPLEMKVASLGGEAARSQFRKVLDTTVDLYSRGKLGTKDAFNAALTGAATVLKEIGKEVTVEELQGRFENKLENFALNQDKSYTLANTLNTGLTTIAITAIPSYLMGRASNRTARADVLTSAIYNAAKDPAKFEADVLKAMNEGKMDIPDSAGAFKFVKYIKDELDTYGNLTDQQGAALTGLIGTRYSLENKKKVTENEIVRKKIDEQIQEINTEIEDVVSGNKKVEVDPFVEPLYKKEKGKATKEAAEPTAKKAYDFDGTLFDNKTGKLTPLGEDVKKRIEAGEDVIVVTAREEGNIQEIQDALGIGADKIEATGDEKKKAEALQKRGISVQDYFDADKKKLDAIQGGIAESQAAAGITKEQQAELDKVSKRAERIQRTLQEDAEVQEEGDEPLLTAEQKKKLETELQTLNQRRDAIQKQSTAEVPVQPGAQTREGVGGQVQAGPQETAGKGKGQGKGKVEGKVQEQINDKEFKDFVDKNVVTPARIEDISNKVINNETLSPREQQIFTSRKADVNKKIKEITAAQKQAPQATKAAEPTPTTTTTKKVTQEAGKAPQKANTVQGFELTKKDGTKAAPAEYRKNEKGNWGRVNAKGGVTPVSSPAQVKQLENALASQTKAAAAVTTPAAETKKAAPAKTPDALKDVESTAKALDNLPEGIIKYTGKLGETKANKRGVIYFTDNRNYASFYETGVEKPSNEALEELLELRPPFKETAELTPKEVIDYYKSIGEELTPFNLIYQTQQEVDAANKVFEKKYQEELNNYNKKKEELQKKAKNYLSPTFIFGRSMNLDIDFSKDSPNDIFKKLKNKGISKNFKGGNFLDNYETDLKKYAEDNGIDYYDGIKGGIRGSLNVSPNEILLINKDKSILKSELPNAYHKAKKDGSNPELVKAVEDLLGVAPSQAAAETKEPGAKDKAETKPPVETVLEEIGTTKAKIIDQIYRFFTKAAAQNDAEAKEMAKLTFAIWERVGQYFGGKNGADWIKSKVQSLGRTSATQATKLGDIRLQSPTVQAAELAEAAERVANNLIEHVDSLMAKGRKVLAAEKDKAKRKQIQQTLQSLKDTKEQIQKVKKDPRFQIDAYHGTLYVIDKFSTEKIGTGEGAQKFGWGLYFTDLESIGKYYAKKLAAREKYSFEGIDDIDNISTHPMTKTFLKDMLKTNPSSRQDAIRWVEKNSKGKSEKVLSELMAFAKILNVDNSITRNLYKTTLFQGKKPGEYTLLEWDKPLSRDFINKMIDGDIVNLTVQEALLNYYGENGEYDITTVEELKDTIENEGLTGQELYNILSLNTEEATPKSASIALLNAGIDGIKYPAESISRGATSDTARGFNYVIFDENDVAINERVQFQQEAAEFRAATIALANNKLMVVALENPNASSFVHEEFHTFEDSLSAAERQTILDSYNENFGEKETEWTTDVSEWGARLWEKYFSNGRKLTEAEVKDKATRTKLQEIFDKFTEYLKGIYEGVIQYTNSKGATKEVNISLEVQALFDKIMGITPSAAETTAQTAETKTAEQLSADIQANIDAATAKEKMQTKDPVQIAGQDLVNNPESASNIPEDIAAALLEYAEGLKINLGGFKKICK